MNLRRPNVVRMTTTSTEIHTLAVATDRKLAEAHASLDTAHARRQSLVDSAHRYVGDEPKVTYRGRQQVRTYRMTDAAAIEVARTTGAAKSWNASALGHTLAELDKVDAVIRAGRATIAECGQVYIDAGGWTRFFLVQGGHIHSSMSCSTCNREGSLTSFGWLPELSGLTEAEAVAAHGAILCTVCFPSAPVEWTNGRELEAAAKKAAQCSGSGRYVQTRRRYAACPDCGASTSVTSTGKLRAHKPRG